MIERTVTPSGKDESRGPSSCSCPCGNADVTSRNASNTMRHIRGEHGVVIPPRWLFGPIHLREHEVYRLDALGILADLLQCRHVRDLGLRATRIPHLSIYN